MSFESDSKIALEAARGDEAQGVRDERAASPLAPLRLDVLRANQSNILVNDDDRMIERPDRLGLVPATRT